MRRLLVLAALAGADDYPLLYGEDAASAYPLPSEEIAGPSRMWDNVAEFFEETTVQTAEIGLGGQARARNAPLSSRSRSSRCLDTQLCT